MSLPRRFVLTMLLLAIAAPAKAVDRGQYKDVPEHIKKWFKGVQNATGSYCCDISDGHRTEYDIREGQYWVPIGGVWWQVPDKAIIRDAGNPLGEAVVWYVDLLGRIEITCFVPADSS